MKKRLAKLRKKAQTYVKYELKTEIGLRMTRIKRKVRRISAPRIDRRKTMPHLFKAGNPGKPKGAKNKYTDLRNAFLDAFEGMGGAEELQRWGSLRKNRSFFYNMIAKMLPKEVILSPNSESPEALPFTIRIEGKKS